MNVLVTGAAGFIGRHLVRGLLAAGHKVTGCDRKDRPLDWPGECGYWPWQVQEIGKDSLVGFNAVAHLAAQPGTEPSWSLLPVYLRDNVQATGALAEEISKLPEEQRPRLLYVSSSSVYGAMATGSEDSPLNPCSPYGVTKLAAEALVKAVAREAGVKWTIARPFSVYGPGQRPDMFFHIAIERLMWGEPIKVTGDGSQQRSFTYVGDVVAALIWMLEHPQVATYQTYNVGNAHHHSIKECVCLIGKLLDTDVQIQHVPNRRGDQIVTQADTRLLEKHSHWRPVIELEAGLVRQVAWHTERARQREATLL